MVIYAWALLLLSLLSLPVRVYVNVSSCARQLAGVPQHWQTADAVVVLHPLEEDRWSLFRSDKRRPQALQIVEPGAASIAVNIKNLNLFPGDKVVVRDPNRVSSITITTANASVLSENVAFDKSPHSLLLRTHPLLILGDAVVVEYIPSIPTLMLPFVVSLREKPVVVLDSYAAISYSLDFRLPTGVDTESTVGAVDEAKEAVCYRKTQPKMYSKARAVARLMIRNEQEQAPYTSVEVESWVFCTGWLVGRGNYLITSHHCIKDASAIEQNGNLAQHEKKKKATSPNVLSNTASSWRDYTSAPDRTNRTVEAVVGFMAETKCCREVKFIENVGIVEATQVSVVTENPELDYALLRVLTNDSTVDLARRYGYLRLRTTGPVDGEPIYIPQHPRGEPKEIASEKNGKPAVVEVLPAKSVRFSALLSDIEPTVWYNADTEPGSSGSPVLSRKDNTVVALHRAGSSETGYSASTGLLNAGIRTDLIARDLQRRCALPQDALAT
ncbi:hypothetical protein KXD40_005983 [Peronospora effusa]|uniref:Serine protease n=1 Tax=Peronospora effusa TaxID=542832 RepID=A0A425C5H2_9STRA|nr:hypothetical protein DD237_007693 [Peronospora effusa]UIZ25983.1 hypothetical protein KXD40_005983 [Peronospora effusa]